MAISPEGSNPQETGESSRGKPGEHAVPEQEYNGRVVDQGGRPVGEDSDVTVDVPSLKLEELKLEVENLRHRTSMQAELADMVKLNVGVETELAGAKLDLSGVDAQALLRANLDNVRAILSRTLDSIDDNPQILEHVARIAEETAGTGERALEGAAGAIGDTREQGAGGNAEDLETEDAGEPNATDAARRKAKELGVDLSRIEGKGAGGRILLSDVKEAAR